MAGRRDPYASYADLYDGEMAERDVRALYGEWREALERAMDRYAVSVRVLVDLACGTGNTTIRWGRRAGWTVIGVDRSRAMLRVARRKPSRVRWYRQDIRDLTLRERADVVTCHFDALNHLLDPVDVQHTFDGVARVLRPGGLFQFDLNTEAALRSVGVPEQLERVGSHYLLARNEFDARTGIATLHRFWFVCEGRVYRRRHIIVHQRAYSTGRIEQQLRAAELSPLEVRVQRRQDGKPARLLYLARRGRRTGDVS